MIAALPTLTLALVLIWALQLRLFAEAPRAARALPAFLALDLLYHLAQAEGWSAVQRALFAGWPSVTAYMLGGPVALVWLAFALFTALVPLERWAYTGARLALVPLLLFHRWRDGPDARAALVIASGQVAGVLVKTWADRPAQTALSCIVWLAAGWALKGRNPCSPSPPG